MDAIYEPSPDDTDPTAEAEMHQGKPGHELHDPWFDSPAQAQEWVPPAGFDSGEA